MPVKFAGLLLYLPRSGQAFGHLEVRMTGALAAIWLLLAFPFQQPGPKETQPFCPSQDMHVVGLNARGEMGMGFSQTATTHHFLLNSTGGAIVVQANSPEDSGSRANIRMHLRHIQRAFQSGDFDIPMFVHGTVPPGVPTMKRRAKNIRYSVEETPNGGRVLIQTTDQKALRAIHTFLRFQITEHQTVDPLSIP